MTAAPNCEIFSVAKSHFSSCFGATDLFVFILCPKSCRNRAEVMSVFSSKSQFLHFNVSPSSHSSVETLGIMKNQEH